MEKSRAGETRVRTLVRKNYSSALLCLVAPRDQSLACDLSVPAHIMKWGRQVDITFISLVCFPEINDGNWFEVEIPQPDAAISAPGGEALFAYIHAENP